MFTVKFGLAICPGTIWSSSVVKIIGSAAVPVAWIFAPTPTINTEASAPSPAFPLITVPASIVNSAGASTITLPSI